MQDGKIIQSVSKAMRLLDILAESSSALSLAEISQKTGWPKSTVHGLLATMRESAVVAQDEDGRYRLGIRLFEYGCILSSSWTIVDRAKPFLQHISYETGDAVFLSILDRGEVITLDRANNRSGLWISAEMGCRLPIHCTSQGKLFLAYMPEEERTELLQRTVMSPYTDRSITTERELREGLSKIRQQGYATEFGEYKTGTRSVAAPIFDETGNVRYAIGVISVSRQLEQEQFNRAISVVVDTAKKISQV